MANKANSEVLEWAFDHDPSDPMLGLSGRDLSGPRVSRRTVLRLLAATGALSAASILAACGPAAASEPTAAPAEEKAAEAATAAPEPTKAPEPTAVPEAEGGGELTAGWVTNEITTLDPAQINQVLQFQIASMVLSGLTHISADLVAEPASVAKQLQSARTSLQAVHVLLLYTIDNHALGDSVVECLPVLRSEFDTSSIGPESSRDSRQRTPFICRHPERTRITICDIIGFLILGAKTDFVRSDVQSVRFGQGIFHPMRVLGCDNCSMFWYPSKTIE